MGLNPRSPPQSTLFRHLELLPDDEDRAERRVAYKKLILSSVVNAMRCAILVPDEPIAYSCRAVSREILETMPRLGIELASVGNERYRDLVLSLPVESHGAAFPDGVRHALVCLRKDSGVREAKLRMPQGTAGRYERSLTCMPH